jgi:membrane-associated protein
MFNVNDIIQTGGLLLIALIIFAVSGMFIGFFFPGDTLLLSAGVFAAAGKLSLASVIVVVALAAIAGDNIGYHIGKRFGRGLFKKPDGILFKQEYLQRAENFYEKYGSRTMLLAHFVPIIRTFAPATAGIAHMNYKQFVLYDAIGDTAWAVSVTLVGYWLGSRIPHLDEYIMLIVFGAIFITLGPTLYHLGKALLKKKSQPQADKSSKSSPKTSK